MRPFVLLISALLCLTLPLRATELVNSSFLGGAAADEITAMLTAPDGSVIVAGVTSSADFPATLGAFQTVATDDEAGFVARISADLSSIIWASYFDFEGDDQIKALAWAADGAIILAGETDSEDFPGLHFGDDDDDSNSDIFAAKLTLDGNTMLWSTRIGGESEEELYAVAVAADGRIALCGEVESGDDFPIENAFDPTYNGDGDAYLCILAADGGSLIASTFIGGASDDEARALISNGGRFLLAGSTESADFPLTAGSLRGDSDAFVLTFDLDGTLLSSVAWGGAADEEPDAIALLSDGRIAIAGGTASDDLPARNGDFGRMRSAQTDLFVALLDVNGQALTTWLIGGIGVDESAVLAVNSLDQIAVAASSNSGDVRPDSDWPFEFAADIDVLLTVFDPAGGEAFVQGFFGGIAADEAAGLSFVTDQQLRLAGMTFSLDLPTSAAAFQPNYAGNSDAFVCLFDLAALAEVYSADLRVLPLETDAGEEVNLSIIVDQLSDDLAALNNLSLTATLHFDADLLTPVDPATRGPISSGRQFVTLENVPVSPQAGQAILTLPCISGLGSAERSSLEIDCLTLQWFAAGQALDVSNVCQSSELQITNIWRFGGNRYINSNKGELALFHSPNPATDQVRIEGYFDAAPAQLRILDNLGRVVLALDELLPTAAGTFDIDVNISTLRSGMYYCRISAGTHSMVRSLIVR